MLLKKSSENYSINSHSYFKSFKKKIKKLSSINKKSSQLFVSTVIILFIGLFVGVILQRNYGFSNLVAKPILTDSFGIVKRQIYSNFVSPEKLFIDIDHNSLMKLNFNRLKSIEAGTTHGMENEWISVLINSNDKSYKAKLRLKGGMADEHLGDKWSFRLKLKGKNTVLQMKEFAVMGPLRRNLIGEWFIREVYKNEGLISRKYIFANIIINGEDKGIYVLDERYDEGMLSHNERKLGPVIKFEAEPIFANNIPGDKYKDFYHSAEIETFNHKKFLQNKELAAYDKQARYLLEKFRLQELSTSEVFDTDLLAKWFAIGNVMGAWHGFGIFNMRFYYNPVTSLLEPVPDDNFNERSYNYANNERLYSLADIYNDKFAPFLRQVFSDISFTKKYIYHLNRVSKESYLDGLFSRYSNEIDHFSYILARDYPLYNFYRESKENIYSNAERIRNVLADKYALKAYLEEIDSEEKIQVSLQNRGYLPLEILYLEDKNGNLFKPLKNQKKILNGRYSSQNENIIKIEFEPNIISKKKVDKFSLIYRVLGLEKNKSIDVFSYPLFDAKKPNIDFIRKQPNFKDFAFIDHDEDKKIINFKTGNWVVEKDIVLPSGYKVNFPEGSSYDFINSSMILSFSPVFMNGKKENRINFFSSDKTAQGITILSAGKESILNHVSFESFGRPIKGDWFLSGALNFYQSPIIMKHVQLKNNVNGDDFVNIVRSTFELSNLTIENAYADALDIDFSNGQISDSKFISCGVMDKGGDCIDFSVSKVELNNIYIDSSSDKGISVGEASNISGQNISISKANIGIANKDKSSLKISKLSIDSSDVGVAVFTKKNQYGKAYASLKDIKLKNIKYPYLVDKNSILLIDDETIETTSEDLRERFYPSNEQ